MPVAKYRPHSEPTPLPGFPIPHWSAPGASLYLGDVRERLRALPTRSVHCVVTSPPYWGLRDYGTAMWEGGSAECDHQGEFFSIRSGKFLRPNGPSESESKMRNVYKHTCAKCGARRVDNQLGMEELPDCLGWATGDKCGGCYVCHMVAVFSEVRRVLRHDGTVWLNLGDTYTGSGGIGGQGKTGMKYQSKLDGHQARGCPVDGLSQGNLVGVPWRVALALQADGWVIRSAMPWVKRNPLPDSTENRPGRSVEDVFLLTKGTDYFFDMEAVKVPGAETDGGTSFSKPGGDQHRTYNRPEYKRRYFRSGDLILAQTGDIEVFNVPVKTYSGAHYATFNPRLIEPMIMAGTSEYGACAECGTPYAPIVNKEEMEKVSHDGRDRDRSFADSRNGIDSTMHAHAGGSVSDTAGWRKMCGCQTDGVLPCIVLDPFVGSGTTVATALELGRAGIGIDLSETYLRENAVPRIEAALRGEPPPQRRRGIVVGTADTTPPPPRKLRGT